MCIFFVMMSHEPKPIRNSFVQCPSDRRQISGILNDALNRLGDNLIRQPQKIVRRKIIHDGDKVIYIATGEWVADEGRLSDEMLYLMYQAMDRRLQHAQNLIRKYRLARRRSKDPLTNDQRAVLRMIANYLSAAQVDICHRKSEVAGALTSYAKEVLSSYREDQRRMPTIERVFDMTVQDLESILELVDTNEQSEFTA